MNNSKDHQEITKVQEVVKKSRGRPRTKPIDLEPKEKQKPGRKGSASKHKEGAKMSPKVLETWINETL